MRVPNIHVARRRGIPPMTFSRVETEPFTFGGGLDQVTPPIALSPGAVVDASNYECAIQGGYRRFAGFERRDGHTAPSAAVYYVLPCNISGAIAVGNTIVGASSGATGLVIAVNAANVVFTMLTGIFQNGEQIRVAGIAQAVSTSLAIPNGGQSPALQLLYQSLAAAQYRLLILPVPGEGRVLGTWVYNGKAYAFRNNAGSTQAQMWVESAGGWTQINLGFELRFNTGTAQINDGDVVTGATSGANGVVKRVVLQTGTWGAGTAAGKLVFQAIAGGNFQAAENLLVAAAPKAKATGAQAAVTLAPNGHFDFDNQNFTGAGTTYRMYGADGVSRGFEFDDAGNVFVAIDTGMAPDTPSYVRGHLNYLVYAFGTQLQNSGLGLPYQWVPLVGAAAYAMGEAIVGLLQQTGDDLTGALFVIGARTLKGFYGTSPANFQLRTISPDLGGVAFTAQNMQLPIYLNTAGIVRADHVQAYGHFELATTSRAVNKYISSKRGLATASVCVPSQNVYRLFFSDGTGISLTFGPPAPYTTGPTTLGLMPLNFGKPVRCAAFGLDANGQEMTLFGSDDGYVYQMDKGTSFDGSAITAFFKLGFNHSKTPRQRKHYRKQVYEADIPAGATISIQQRTYDGDADYLRALTVQNVNAGSLWDQATWDAAIWSEGGGTIYETDLSGDGTRVSALLYQNSAIQGPDTFYGAITHFSPGRLQR